MKISKLFHWLYAFLMLLPCFFIGANVIYYGFNGNAISQTYEKEEPIYYQTNEVSSIEDLVLGNVYTLNFSGNTQSVLELRYSDIFNVRGTPQSTLASESTALSISKHLNDNGIRINFISDPTNANYYYNVSCDFVLSEFLSCNELGLSYISKCNVRIFKEYEEVTYTNGIVDSLVQSTERTFELPMFSWTSDNFIVAPFAYLSGLFGIQSGNVFVLFLDYWATISIIYLCFDIVMYVPLLAHRWIDKAVIE